MSLDNSTWPPELDALVASANHHQLMFENEDVRVLETKIGPGETTQVHTHCWPGALYILSWSDFIRRDSQGNVLLDTRRAGISLKPGESVGSNPLGPHSLENIGTQDLHVIGFEMKVART